MRRFVLALLIVLLPLRGWVGDAMAMEMATQAQTEPASAHESAVAGNAMHADCAGHAALQESEPQTQSHCESCSACQICHTVAMTSSIATLAAVHVPLAQPQAGAPLFSSAERAAGFKPPIS
jgi:hypothetical protein